MQIEEKYNFSKISKDNLKDISSYSIPTQGLSIKYISK